MYQKKQNLNYSTTDAHLIDQILVFDEATGETWVFWWSGIKTKEYN